VKAGQDVRCVVGSLGRAKCPRTPQRAGGRVGRIRNVSPLSFPDDGGTMASDAMRCWLFISRNDALLYALTAFTFALTGCSERAPVPVSPGSDPSGSIALAQSIRFTGEVAYQTVDANLDGYYEGLVAQVAVELVDGGEFLILGVLEKEGLPVASRPAYESVLSSEARISAGSGITTVAIAFSGEQILQSGQDGPYDLILDAIGDKSHANTAIQTPAYDHTRFAEIGAILEKVTNTAIDEDGDGRFESMESSFDVQVRTSGDYRLQGNLRRGDVEVHVGRRFTLPRGLHVLKLRFPIPPTLLPGRAALVSPFEGMANVIDGTGHTIGGIEFLVHPLSIETASATLGDPSLTLALMPEERTYSLEEGNSLTITARLENTGEENLLIAHPRICLPGAPKQGEGITVDPNPSHILVEITTPAGDAIFLRNSIFHHFLSSADESTGTDHFVLAPGETRDIVFYKFHPYSNINPWDVIREPIFTMPGSYRIRVLLKNHYPCAWFDETGCAEPWMGEVASNVMTVEFR